MRLSVCNARVSMFKFCTMCVGCICVSVCMWFYVCTIYVRYAWYAVRIEVYECMLAGKSHRNAHSSMVGGNYKIMIIIIIMNNVINPLKRQSQMD